MILAFLLAVCCQFPLGEDRTLTLFIESYPRALTLPQFYQVLDASCRNFEGACDVRFKRTLYRDEANVIIRCCDLDSSDLPAGYMRYGETTTWTRAAVVRLNRCAHWDFELARKTTAHELGHVLSLEHMGMGLMAATPNRVWQVGELETRRLVTLYGPPKRLVARR